MLSRIRDVAVIAGKTVELNQTSTTGSWLWGDGSEILWSDDTPILVEEE